MKKMNEKCNWKKWTSLCMASFLCMGTFTACGQKNEEKNKKEDVTLTFAIWDKLQKDGMEQMASAFEEKNPGIKIKVEMTPWDQYWTKMQAAGTGNTLPDIFWMHPEQVYKYAEGGKIMDLTELIENSSNVDLNKFPQNVNDDFNVNGKQYGMLNTWKPGPSKEVYTLCENDIIHLGNYTFQILEVPSHTLGSIVLWEENHGWMFTGDIMLTWEVWGHLTDGFFAPSASLKIYYKSLKKLLNYSEKIKCIFPSHGVPNQTISKKYTQYKLPTNIIEIYCGVRI